MSLVKKQLPPLPMKNKNNQNLEDISLQSTYSTPSPSTTRLYPKPVPVSSHSAHGYNPSPLKNQVGRSLSTHSNGSKTSNNSNNSTDSKYFIHVNKTPTNLTPSQRLKLRKDQLNSSITQFKLDQFPVNPVIKSKPPVYKYDSDDDEDLEIDNTMAIFNVPISQPLTSIANNEKFTFTNSDRKFSLHTDSTRASSILSHESTNDTEASFDYEAFNSRDFNKTNSVISNSSFLSQSEINDLASSTDALELTLLFNQNDFTQINEEARQKRTMLANFKKINQSLPQNLNQISTTTSHSAPPKFPPPSPLRFTKSVSNIHSRPEPVKHSLTYSGAGASTQYVSYTRHTWLPPKSPQDKVKHQKQSESIISKAMLDENQRHMKKLAHLHKLKAMKEKDAKIWESEILPNGSSRTSKSYQDKIKTSHVKHMYWRGLPDTLRSKIWWRQIGNSINLNELTAEVYFNKYHSFKELISQYNALLRDNEGSNLSVQLKQFVNYNPNIIELKKFYDRLNQDLMDTYPEIDYFQNRDTIEMLTEIIVSFIIYMNETINKFKFNSGNFKNFIASYYFTGLNNLTAMMFFTYKNSYMTFTSLCNMFTKNNLLNILITHQMESHKLSKSILESLLYDKFINKFEKKFQKDLNRLYTHFKIIQLKPIDYLPNLLLSLFTNLFNFELSCHTFDIWVFENDEFLIKCLLGLFNQISHKLFGSKQEILNLIGENNRSLLNQDVSTSQDFYRYLNVGYEYEFIESVQKF